MKHDEMKLSPELERVLLKRITAAIERAKYYPASITPSVAAKEVLRPYTMRKD